MLPILPTTSADTFFAVDIRVGQIIHVEPFPEARKPAYKLTIDFGVDIGKRRSSAQITHYYTPETLIGCKVIAVVNFPPRQVWPFMSEVLTLGTDDGNGQVLLVAPDENAPLGAKFY